jgi:hypothetical protein
MMRHHAKMQSPYRFALYILPSTFYYAIVLPYLDTYQHTSHVTLSRGGIR